MIVKSIEIKNFRNIEDLKIDFTSNSKGSKNDVERGIFIDIKGGKIISKVNALIGANATSKTSILNALQFWNFLNKNIINRKVFLKQLIDENKDQKNLTPKKIEALIEQKIEELNSNKISKNDFKIFLKYKDKEIRKTFLMEARKRDKPISIILTFWDKKSKNLISSKTKMTVNDIEYDSNFFEGKIFDIIKFKERRFYINEIFPNILLKDKVDNSLFELIGEKKFKNLINIVDPNIQKAYIDEKKIFYSIKESENDITFDKLSSGTKRFLYIFEFLYVIKNKNGIILIDELETELHRELALSLIDFMNMIAKKNKNISFIFTTHNPMLLNNSQINYKQIFEIKRGRDEKITSQKLSLLFKSNISLESKYKRGIISSFPASSYAWDVLYDLLNR